jgi:alkylation response protein AidB-like acyl-CoA dehydrogenase
MRPFCDAAENLIATVDQVRSTIESYVVQSEAERQLADEIYDTLLDAGFFGALVPKSLGGLELHPVEAYRVWELLARIDSATGWNLQISSAVSTFTSWLSQEGLEEIFYTGPDVVLAGALAPPATAVRVPGGLRITGRLNIASGCHRAQWFAVPLVEVVDDKPQFDPLRENPPNLISFVSRDEIDIEDTWFTSGMRGTFSADVLVDDVFVPNARVGLVKRQQSAARAPAVKGALYGTMPWPGIQGEAIVSVAIAHRAIEKLQELAVRKSPNYTKKMLKDREVAQHHAGKARALIDAARLYLIDSISVAYDDCERDGIISLESVERCQLAACFAAEMSAQAVDLVHEAVGIHGVRLEAGFERHFRDVHTLTQHASKAYSRYEDVGQLMFGMSPEWFLLTL